MLLRLIRPVRVLRFLLDLRMLVSAAGRSVPGAASQGAATFGLILIDGMVGCSPTATPPAATTWGRRAARTALEDAEQGLAKTLRTDS